MISKKTIKWTKKQLDILYECWKNSDSNKVRIQLIQEKLPNIPPLIALNKMRLMAKTESKWLSMTTRKKNKKEKEELKIILEKKQKKEEYNKKKLERNKKREEKRKIKEYKLIIEKLKKSLKSYHFKIIEEKIENEIFFCHKTQQFMNNISCLFRAFSNEYVFSIGGLCEKCKLMDKYISIIQEVIENDSKKRNERNKTSERGKNKKENSSIGTIISDTKTSCNSKCI